MSKYTSLTGLWSRDTARGVVLSAKLTDATKQAIRAAIDEPGDGELVVFTNDKRDNEKSPTHRLVISRKDEDQRG
jgi:hypothetical protein